jgi:tartrate/fumarate subfamily iron-sulfur-dependent hydro-lyase beta chain
MSEEITLVPPVSEDQARGLKCGDVVFLDGIVLAWRDRAVERMFELSEKGEAFPVDLRGSVHWHCGPIVQETPEGWTVISAGPTASTRFSLAEIRAIEEFGVRLIVGKGGMFSEAKEAMKRKGAAFLASVGGAASFYARQIVRVKEVHWLDLGLPEAIWVLEMKAFGPLLVTMDSHGRSLYDELGIEENLQKIYSEKGIDPDGYPVVI